ncbi:inner-membrane translocator [Kribbella flavida DSM 17836]|uniref:Inner-membrane translocator n=1 Tax=Kribbella flavida (strain DSM 17836 / JCM 10339 / NBRC 14399) TaxID=479435 RepID=D2PU30_KRIFD|nr:ABC transporter permease [Kribbella flavida]ADB33313.1 inner-membrane translocator [Kribbella flavida DSM 17836]
MGEEVARPGTTPEGPNGKSPVQDSVPSTTGATPGGAPAAGGVSKEAAGAGSPGRRAGAEAPASPLGAGLPAQAAQGPRDGLPAQALDGATASATASGQTTTTQPAAPRRTGGLGLFSGGIGRNVGLLVALVLLCIVGVATAGDTFATGANLLTILRAAAVIGVVSVGMTFVITGGGIDLSVGAILALASVWATTLATQQMALDYGVIFMVSTALLVGAACGLVNGVLVAYGKIVPFIATLAMLAAARGLAEIISDRRTQIITVNSFSDVFGGSLIGVPVLVWMFVLVAALGWVLLNRTTFGRRTFAVGGNAEAARLAGIKVQRHTVALYVLLGVCCGIAAVMLMARTTTGTSTHGVLYELDAIAAVVIGGTLLSGGRGTIVGTVFGVLIFTTLNNVFTLNNLSLSAQSVAKGLIIVIAVLLQQRLAARATSS